MRKRGGGGGGGRGGVLPWEARLIFTTPGQPTNCIPEKFENKKMKSRRVRKCWVYFCIKSVFPTQTDTVYM